MRFSRIPSGAGRADLLALFRELEKALTPPSGSVLLDITHGFRAQPFLAAAAIAFVRTTRTEPPEIRVVYGAFEAKGDDGVAPIWDLTYLVELVDWTRALQLFLRTGRAEVAARETERLGRSLAKAWAEGGKAGPRPGLDQLGRALQRFGCDLETVRTGHLLLGSGGRKGSAAKLLDALDAARGEVSEHLPPLASVLEQVREMVEPLSTAGNDLSGEAGHRAVAALARLYRELGRWLEAAATVREGWINRYSPPGAARPGAPDFDDGAREKAEKHAFEGSREKRDFLTLTALRNDLLHAQYRKEDATRDGAAITVELARIVEVFARSEPKLTAPEDEPGRVDRDGGSVP